MTNRMHRRLANLEAEFGVGTDLPPNLFVHFVDNQSSIANHAEHSGREWHRRPDEEQEEFEARIVADLTAAGYRPPFIVYLSD